MKLSSLALPMAFGIMLTTALVHSQQIDPPVYPIYSPVVTDDAVPNEFVYPDAFSLDSLIDPANPGGDIWSYSGDGTYRINYKLATNDPIQPGSSRRLNSFPDDRASLDNDLRTLTFRNVALSPLGGPNVNPPGMGVIAQYTKVITLHQSDGTVVRNRSFLIYTSDGGLDHLSGISLLTPHTARTVPSPTQGWSPVAVLGQTTFTSGSNGLCIEVPFGTNEIHDANFGAWVSPYQILTLVKDNAYRVRIEVEANPPVPEAATPLWDFVIDNIPPPNYGRGHKFGMDFLNWDNFNSSANSAGQRAFEGRHSFDIWWAPMAVQAEDWNDPLSGFFTANQDAFNDGRFHFRVLDVSGAIDGHNDAGNLCLKSFQVDRIDIGDLDAIETLYYEPAPVAQFFDPGIPQEPSVVGANMIVDNVFRHHSTVISNEGAVTLAPREPAQFFNGWDIELVTISPGDRDLRFDEPASLPDNYPIVWQGNQLLKYTVVATAPPGGENNPPDVFRMIIDSVTNELACENILSSGSSANLGFPKSGKDTTYTTFFFTHNRSGSPTPEYRRLRPRFGIFCVQNIFSNGLPVNNGGVTIKSMKVERIEPAGL